MLRIHHLALAGCFAAASCDSSVTDPAPTYRLVRLTADDQALDVGQSVKLSVRLSDLRNAVQAGVTVEWTVSGAGRVEPSSVTDADGIASAQLIVGLGENRVAVRLQAGEDRSVFVMHGCLRCGEWTLVPLRTGGRAWASALASDGDILIVGGFDRNVSTNAIDVFEPAGSRLMRAAELPLALAGSTTALVDGQLYVIGGFADQYIANGMPTVLVLDPASGRWSWKAPLPDGRFLSAGAVLNGRIYVAGGRTVCGYDGYCAPPLADLEIDDPVLDRWTHGPRMNDARALAGAAVLDGRLYVAGGTAGDIWWNDPKAGLSSVEAYDPVTDTWTRKAALPDAGAIQLAAGEGTLYAFAGHDGQAYARVFEYDSAADTWTRLRNAPVSLIGPAVAAADGRLYVFGGYEVDPADPYHRDLSQHVYVLSR